MKTPIVLVTLAASFLGCSAAFAQAGGVGSPPMNATSPLAIGPGMAVGPTGIPLGATEMTTPGISPAPSAMGTMGCSGTAGPTSSAASPLFDGGGMGGASSACAGMGGAAPSMPAQSTLQVGRTGIPLGSTELGSAGLSPPPPVSPMFVSPVVPPTAAPLAPMGAPPMTGVTPPCPVTGAFSDSVTVRGARSSAGAAGPPGC